MKKLTICLLLGVMASGAAVAQSLSTSLGLYVYPGEGQSIEQLAIDENECYQWAQQTSGVDPNNPMAGVQIDTAEQQSQGAGAGRGAARGAAKGALIGEITDNDRSEYAAAGALIGASRGRRQAESQNQQAQQQAQANNEAQAAARIDSFKKAYTACMQGRKYTVT
jgi:hypothetical protein